RLSVQEGPDVDAIRPAAAQSAGQGRFTLIGRALGPPAVREPQLKIDGGAPERLDVSIPVPSTAFLARDPSNPGRMFIPAAAATAWHGFQYTLARVDPAGTAPVLSNPMFIAAALAPVVLEHQPNTHHAPAQL